MIAITKIMSLSFLIMSLVLGLMMFYLISDLPKEEKKKQIEEMISQFINFIIFLWLSKIFLNISIFIEDPLAILAYPSDSRAFYLAILLSGFFLLYKSKRGKWDVLGFFSASLITLIAGAFFYEFSQYAFNTNKLSFGGMMLHAFLFIVWIFLQGRITTQFLLKVLLICWTFGLFLLSLLYPYVTFFGYIMSPWFLGVFLVSGVTSIRLIQRKRYDDERN